MFLAILTLIKDLCIITLTSVDDGFDGGCKIDMFKGLALSSWIFYAAMDLKEISRLTDIITVVLLVVIGLAILFLIIYSAVVHKKTKKPVRDVTRFNKYETVSAAITNIEKVPYYVSRYEKPDPKNDPYSINYQKNEKKEFSLMTPAVTGEKFDKLRRVDPIYNSTRVITERDEEQATTSLAGLGHKQKAVEKYRYCVRYEFSIGDGNNLYSGEFFVYEENDNVKVGKNVDVKYDPSNPMVNFTSYSSPVGV